MATELIVTARAKQALAAASDWYEADRPGRGKAFLARANACFTAIRRTPRGGRVCHGVYRQVKVPKFPYIAVYRYDATTDTAYVVTVWHTSRDPDELRRRL